MSEERRKEILLEAANFYSHSGIVREETFIALIGEPTEGKIVSWYRARERLLIKIADLSAHM